MRKLVLIPLLVITLRGVASSPGDGEEGAAYLRRAHEALTDVIIHDIFSPPVSARIYLYAHIAAYETLVKSDPDSFQSLHGQISGFPLIPDPEQRVSYPLAALHAFLLTGKRLVFSESAMEDSLNAILTSYRRNVSGTAWKASLAYGRTVSDRILGWVREDHYADTRKLPRYSFRKDEGKWIPTPPAYMAAIEPYWNRIRPIALDSASQFRPTPPIPFDKNSESAFYALAYEVYKTVRDATPEQRDIANFWDCNPFAVNVHGHMNFATKKLSPGGHWLSIVGIASEETGAGMARTAAAYTLTAIALFDGFISCWDEKYRSNLIRPETYINTYIDATWKPLLQTPPFPEYTSGHSVISTAAATVLTRFFGDAFAFTDTSELPFGYASRSFDSFIQACNEAAISRLYGGIHYRQAIEEGQIQGRRVGEIVLKKIHLLRESTISQ